ncbi:Major facilitator superfamily domaingeneral substrate transporter [Penicillium lividum]|nr:Major facilitator superfamily domaingeneral substrate transporter [Penicillium lividum]
MSSSFSASNDSALCSTKSDRHPTSTASDNYQACRADTPCKEIDLKDGMNEEDLPPVDGGVHAWLFLLAATMLEALVWGFAFSFGIFQDYYSMHEPFKGSKNIAVIGTCAMGIAYLLAPFTIIMMILIPRLARWVSTVGVGIVCVSLALSSFANTTTQLILSQGAAYGIGACFSYTPSILYMSEWFVKRKGLAFGISLAGSGVSGVIFPPLIEWLLGKYGVETTLRVSAVALFILAVPFLYWHKPRLPPPKIPSYDRLNFSFLYSRVYNIYQLGNTVEALGFFLPTIYLPTYARSLGASEIVSSLTVTLINLSWVFSSVIMGYLSDRYHCTTCILISTVGTVLSVFFLWGFATNIPILYLFCVTYGLLAGGYTATWAGVAQKIGQANPGADVSVIYPFMEFGRGIGNLVSGPLSEALLKADNWQGSAYGVYGSGYGTLVVCTGATALIGGVSIVARQFNWV